MQEEEKKAASAMAEGDGRSAENSVGGDSLSGERENFNSESRPREAEYVGDDEEYSYRGYAEDNGGYSGAVYRDSDEELSYTGYAGEALEEEEERGSVDDYIIEEFSAEQNVSRVTKLTKIPVNVVTYIFAAAYFIVGVVCVAFTEYVTEYLSLIVGSMMLVVGVVRFILAMVHHEYRTLKTNQTASSLIIAVLGGMILFQYFDPEDDPITLVSIAWGILGLVEGAHAFNHAFKRIANSERFIYYLVKGLVELVVAFVLLYRPSSESAHHLHIIVFGINLILDSITMIPKFKNFLSMK